MNHVPLNFKNESVFFLKTFWTNGFSIWTVILEITGLFKQIPLIFSFRESLWQDQSMWVFFVPLVYQIAFRYFLQDKINPKLKTTSSKKKMLFVGFVLGLITASPIIEYAYFAGDALLIIPENHEEVKGKNYVNVPWLKALNWGFVIIFLVGARYRKHLVNNNEVIERHNDNLNTGIQISLITVGFSLALSSFDVLHTLPRILNDVNDSSI